MIQCRHFNGYKPCGKSEICDSLCPSFSETSTRILIVHLEALGAVIRSTSLLPAIRRKFPNAHITWVTAKPADQLLMQNSLVDRVLTTAAEDLLVLSVLEFDVAFNIDKSLKSAGILKLTSFDLLYGFSALGTTGAIVPATPAAEELWELGLSDHKKFFVNQKSETQLMIEALELGPFHRDPYILRLSDSEKMIVAQRKKMWAPAGQIIIGLNTGCAGTIPYKKLTIEMHRKLIAHLQLDSRFRVVLLGGREDTLRNERMAHGLDVIQSPTEGGLRDGVLSVAACDIVVSGDSLGMHLSIALKKWTVAWFGPTCSQEIDLFERGVKVLTRASCSPCWKRSCQKNPMCYDLVSIEELIGAIDKGFRFFNEEAVRGEEPEFTV
jgi:heptosyltransferase-2